ncbi:DUF1428 domain-containing protein [Xinfangfangia pollutisoli]|uniref:DUF1428 domain-containing protein n=1 Tax=Xinfangfangia pollutisoli TaxID=2865960 RepID=UPI001CD4493C|nr:DUF1428 domain-containing protein [Xinfangfangia pollutisoli]
MAYVDGFLIPVPDARKEDYRAHEEKWWPFFRDRGATGLAICWGDDVPPGERTDFRRAVALEDGETVVFAWMTWPDRETRDKAFAAMMQDGMEMPEMPFDGKRMVFGGFVPILALGQALG